MADLSKITLPNGSNYALKDLQAAASIESTGGNGVRLKKRDGTSYSSNLKINTQDLERPDSLRGLNDVTLQSLVSTTRANRLAFLPADQIIIEQTVDGGTTWTDAGVTDSTKLALFSETRPPVYLPRINDAPNLLCGLRITFTAMKYNVPEGTPETEKYNYWNSTHVVSQERYCNLKEFYFWLSSNNNSIGITVQRASGANSTNWINIFSDDSFYMTGWSGCDYVRFGQSTFGGAVTQTGNHWNYRIILMTKGVNGTSTMGTSTAAQSISEIRGYGDSVWGYSNRYMMDDHMYTKDVNKNVTFPANVTATNFVGKINNHTISKDVPSDAIFTDTTYSAGTGLSLTGTTFANTGVTGVKGDSESEYRTGQVNLTKVNIGLSNVENKSSATIRGELTKSNVTTALGYTPYTPAEVDALVSAVFHYKGTKATYAEVAALTGMKTGDVWQVTADNSEYVYNGSTWEKLGPTIDLSGYLTSVSVAGQTLTPGSNSITVAQLKTALGLGNAAYKDVETVLANDAKLPTGAAVQDYLSDNYVSKSAELLTTNFFAPGSLRGPYISKIDNAFYCADKRFNVFASIDGASVSSLHNLFNGNYETQTHVPAGKSITIIIDCSNTSNGYFPGYPYGNMLISFYHVAKPESVSGRVYCNYEAHGIGWHDVTFNIVSDSGIYNTTYRGYNGKYNISKFEFTITAPSSGEASITEIEMHLDRPSSAYTPFLSKYNAETLYYPLTAPSFIGDLTGSASKVNNHTINSDVPANAKFTDTTYSNGTGLALNGTTFSLAGDVVTAGSAGPTAAVTGNDGTTVAIPRITVDEYGRVTGLTSYNLTNKNTTYSVATTSANGLMSSTDKGVVDTVKYKVSLTALTTIPANSDLNDTQWLKTGSYANPLTANTSTISNIPSGLTEAFMLNVYSPLTGNSSADSVSGNYIYRVQELTEYSWGKRWSRLCSTDGSGNWRYPAWVQIYPTTVATGDSNGQVKIAGTNVSVKGLGSAAYADTETTVANDAKLPTGAAVKSFVEGKGYVTTDTKNTAGSTDTSSKIFLIGATSQATSAQTYSDNEVYATSGVLTTKAVQVGGTKATMQYNATTEAIDFIFS